MLTCILPGIFPGNAALAAPQPMRLGLSAVVIGEQQATLAQWQKYLETHLRRPVNFMQRRSYHKFLEMFLEEQLDAGWIDSSQYLKDSASLRLLAVGVWQGKPMYQSYLIVPDSDTTTRSIADLRGRIFGYADPDSSSSHHVSVSEILRLGANPDKFFSRTIYTHSHTKLINSVAAGLVNGARVDGYIYQQMRRYYPDVIAQTRLVQQSGDYGFPPIVARASLPEADFRELQDVLLNMHKDEEGRALLDKLGLDRFIAGDSHLYDNTAALLQAIRLDGAGNAE